jgi:hypothetical protein
MKFNTPRSPCLSGGFPLLEKGGDLPWRGGLPRELVPTLRAPRRKSRKRARPCVPRHGSPRNSPTGTNPHSKSI